MISPNSELVAFLDENDRIIRFAEFRRTFCNRVQDRLNIASARLPSARPPLLKAHACAAPPPERLRMTFRGSVSQLPAGFNHPRTGRKSPLCAARVHSGRPAFFSPSIHLARSSGRRIGIRLLTTETFKSGSVCSMLVTMRLASSARPDKTALTAAIQL